MPMGAWMARYKALAAAERNRVQITDIKAIVRENLAPGEKWWG